MGRHMPTRHAFTFVNFGCGCLLSPVAQSKVPLGVTRFQLGSFTTDSAEDCHNKRIRTEKCLVTAVNATSISRCYLVSADYDAVLEEAEVKPHPHPKSPSIANPALIPITKCMYISMIPMSINSPKLMSPDERWSRSSRSSFRQNAFRHNT
jgi:hypothetical protein